MSWWHAYWAWTGGNVGAMPEEFAVTVVVTGVLVKPIRWAWHRLVGRHLAAARAAAEAGHRIAADLYEHHTGRAHPDAPAKPEGPM